LLLAGLLLVVGMLAATRGAAELLVVLWLATVFLIIVLAGSLVIILLLAALLPSVEAISGLPFVGIFVVVVLAGIAAARHGAAATLLHRGGGQFSPGLLPPPPPLFLCLSPASMLALSARIRTTASAVTAATRNFEGKWGNA
jgi:hypothetical protein